MVMFVFEIKYGVDYMFYDVGVCDLVFFCDMVDDYNCYVFVFGK